MPSKTSIGVPSGLPSDLTMIGGTAPAVITLATRPLPCCAAYRTTSPPPVEWPTRTRSFRSSVSISSARSLAYVSMSLPVYVFDERPCPRRSCAMVRYPASANNFISTCHASELSGPPVAEDDRPADAVLGVVDLGSVGGGDVGHALLFSVESWTEIRTRCPVSSLCECPLRGQSTHRSTEMCVGAEDSGPTPRSVVPGRSLQSKGNDQ